MGFSNELKAKLKIEASKFIHKGLLYIEFEGDNDEVYANYNAARVLFGSELSENNIYKYDLLVEKIENISSNMFSFISQQINNMKDGILESFTTLVDFSVGKYRIKVSLVESLDDPSRRALMVTTTDRFFNTEHALQKDLLLRTFESETSTSGIGYGFITLDNDGCIHEVYMSRTTRKLLLLEDSNSILIGKDESKPFEKLLNSLSDKTLTRIANIRTGRYKSFTETIKIISDSDIFYREIIITLVDDYSDSLNRSKVAYVIKDSTDQVMLREESIEILDVYNMAIYTQYPLRNGYNLYPGRINSYGMFQVPIKRCKDGSLCFDEFRKHLALYNTPEVLERFDKYGEAIAKGEMNYDIMDINVKVNSRVRSYSLRRSIREIDDEGRVIKILVSFVDVSADLMKAKHLEKQLEIDILTKVKNRYSLFENHKLEKGTILYIDLDKFKQINDTYGHSEGDVYLQVASKILKEYANSFGADVYRIGGDEFIIFTSDIYSYDELKLICDGLVNAKNKYNNSQRYEHEIRFSFGADSSIENNNFLEALIVSSDKALYIAKKDKNRGYCIAEMEKNDK